MTFIRRNPFRDVDPKMTMIDVVAAEAADEGHALSENERSWLACERPKELPPDARERLKGIIEKIIERERWSEEARNNPRSFINAIEWAGDQEYPYVVELAEEVFCDNPGPEAGLQSPRTWLKDKAQLIVTALVLVAIMFAIVMVAGFVFHWR